MWVEEEEKAAELTFGRRLTKKFRGHVVNDLEWPGHRELKGDVKASARFRHHALFRQVRDAYAHGDDDLVVLVTHERSTGHWLVCLSPGLWRRLIAGELRLL